MLNKILKTYRDNDVCMAEILATTKCSEIGDLTIEQAFELYVGAMKEADGDIFKVIKEGEEELL